MTNLNIEGPIVYGTVRSQSGISDWSFTIDFNDFGRITGSYWLSSDNRDSEIPSTIAKRMKSDILDCLSRSSSSSENEFDSDQDMSDTNSEKDTSFFQSRTSEKGNLLAIRNLCIITFLLLGAMFFVDWYTAYKHQTRNEIQISYSSADLEGENYENVFDSLKTIGFENIKLVKKEDLILGFLTKDGTVESISINGTTSFSSNDWFPKDAVVRITYHTFPSD